jgi:hypothetical protein
MRDFCHLLVGDFAQRGRIGHKVGIGGFDTIHIGVNLDRLRLKGSAQRRRGGVAPPRPSVVMAPR